ncbi:hypothetical protein J6590_012987 [Homalodisca vitripennis]|nr:hypothetical protein J6590_012987 [Homalodisca vitripennis]
MTTSGCKVGAREVNVVQLSCAHSSEPLAGIGNYVRASGALLFSALGKVSGPRINSRNVSSRGAETWVARGRCRHLGPELKVNVGTSPARPQSHTTLDATSYRAEQFGDTGNTTLCDSGGLFSRLPIVYASTAKELLGWRRGEGQTGGSNIWTGVKNLRQSFFKKTDLNTRTHLKRPHTSLVQATVAQFIFNFTQYSQAVVQKGIKLNSLQGHTETLAVGTGGKTKARRRWREHWRRCLATN